MSLPLKGIERCFANHLFRFQKSLIVLKDGPNIYCHG